MNGKIAASFIGYDGMMDVAFEVGVKGEPARGSTRLPAAPALPCASMGPQIKKPLAWAKSGRGAQDFACAAEA